jgi:hypothetical protein
LARRLKPLKRLALRSSLSTGLKTGVNERIDALSDAACHLSNTGLQAGAKTPLQLISRFNGFSLSTPHFRFFSRSAGAYFTRWPRRCGTQLMNCFTLMAKPAE